MSTVKAFNDILLASIDILRFFIDIKLTINILYNTLTFQTPKQPMKRRFEEGDGHSKCICSIIPLISHSVFMKLMNFMCTIKDLLYQILLIIVNYVFLVII